MAAEAEVSRSSSLTMHLEVQRFASERASVHAREVRKLQPAVAVISPPPAPSIGRVQVAELSSAHHAEIRSAEAAAVEVPESPIQEFVPSIRSGSFADIGPRRNMEDEHLRIDDLSKHLGPSFQFPQPSAFYGVFDGHGGPEAAAYVKENIIKLIFGDAKFPVSSEVDESFLVEVTTCLHRAYLLADQALADDGGVSSSTGTTALTAFIFSRILMVANTGDCRAVLCRKGMAINMSHDHRPTNLNERRRVEKVGAFVDDGYLNGVLSVTRALGDWDMKYQGSVDAPCPLIPDPEFRQVVLTEDDEFLVIGCDGIWDVISSQHAINIVRRGLRRHDNPDHSAQDLVKEAFRLGAHDNLTVVVICLLGSEHGALPSSSSRQRKRRFFSLPAEALCSLRGLLDGGGSR